MEHEGRIRSTPSFTLLSPTSLASQCFHNSQSCRIKLTQIPHKTSLNCHVNPAHETPHTFIFFLIWSLLHYPSIMSHVREKAMAQRKKNTILLYPRGLNCSKGHSHPSLQQLTNCLIWISKPPTTHTDIHTVDSFTSLYNPRSLC